MRLWQTMGLVTVGVFSMLSATAATVAKPDDWQYSLPDNITNAGEYYNDALITSTDVTVIGTTPSEAWSLAVRLKTAISGIDIHVTRTGSGSGDSEPTGGTNSLPLSTFFQPLCSGTGSINNIPLEYQISNLGVDYGYGNKFIELEYQVTTTP